jgi:hypothetical protein
MVTAERTGDVQGRLRKAHATLVAARALLNLEPPCRDDAVSRASVAALQAARALVDSKWARDSQPHWDPNWRPGMPPPGEPRDPYSVKRRPVSPINAAPLSILTAAPAAAGAPPALGPAPAVVRSENS